MAANTSMTQGEDGQDLMSNLQRTFAQLTQQLSNRDAALQVREAAVAHQQEQLQTLVRQCHKLQEQTSEAEARLAHLRQLANQEEHRLAGLQEASTATHMQASNEHLQVWQQRLQASEQQLNAQAQRLHMDAGELQLQRKAAEEEILRRRCEVEAAAERLRQHAAHVEDREHRLVRVSEWAQGQLECLAVATDAMQQLLDLHPELQHIWSQRMAPVLLLGQTIHATPLARTAATAATTPGAIAHWTAQQPHPAIHIPSGAPGITMARAAQQPSAAVQNLQAAASTPGASTARAPYQPSPPHLNPPVAPGAPTARMPHQPSPSPVNPPAAPGVPTARAAQTPSAATQDSPAASVIGTLRPAHPPDVLQGNGAWMAPGVTIAAPVPSIPSLPTAPGAGANAAGHAHATAQHTITQAVATAAQQRAKTPQDTTGFSADGAPAGQGWPRTGAHEALGRCGRCTAAHDPTVCGAEPHGPVPGSTGRSTAHDHDRRDDGAGGVQQQTSGGGEAGGGLDVARTEGGDAAALQDSHQLSPWGSPAEPLRPQDHSTARGSHAEPALTGHSRRPGSHHPLGTDPGSGRLARNGNEGPTDFQRTSTKPVPEVVIKAEPEAHEPDGNAISAAGPQAYGHDEHAMAAAGAEAHEADDHAMAAAGAEAHEPDGHAMAAAGLLPLGPMATPIPHGRHSSSAAAVPHLPPDTPHLRPAAEPPTDAPCSALNGNPQVAPLRCNAACVPCHTLLHGPGHGGTWCIKQEPQGSDASEAAAQPEGAVSLPDDAAASVAQVHITASSTAQHGLFEASVVPPRAAVQAARQESTAASTAQHGLPGAMGVPALAEDPAQHAAANLAGTEQHAAADLTGTAQHTAMTTGQRDAPASYAAAWPLLQHVPFAPACAAAQPSNPQQPFHQPLTCGSVEWQNQSARPDDSRGADNPRGVGPEVTPGAPPPPPSPPPPAPHPAPTPGAHAPLPPDASAPPAGSMPRLSTPGAHAPPPPAAPAPPAGWMPWPSAPGAQAPPAGWMPRPSTPGAPAPPPPAAPAPPTGWMPRPSTLGAQAPPAGWMPRPSNPGAHAPPLPAAPAPPAGWMPRPSTPGAHVPPPPGSSAPPAGWMPRPLTPGAHVPPPPGSPAPPAGWMPRLWTPAPPRPPPRPPPAPPPDWMPSSSTSGPAPQPPQQPPSLADLHAQTPSTAASPPSATPMSHPPQPAAWTGPGSTPGAPSLEPPPPPSSGPADGSTAASPPVPPLLSAAHAAHTHMGQAHAPPPPPLSGPADGNTTSSHTEPSTPGMLHAAHPNMGAAPPPAAPSSGPANGNTTSLAAEPAPPEIGHAAHPDMGAAPAPPLPPSSGPADGITASSPAQPAPPHAARTNMGAAPAPPPLPLSGPADGIMALPLTEPPPAGVVRAAHPNAETAPAPAPPPPPSGPAVVNTAASLPATPGAEGAAGSTAWTPPAAPPPPPATPTASRSTVSTPPAAPPVPPHPAARQEPPQQHHHLPPSTTVGGGGLCRAEETRAIPPPPPPSLPPHPNGQDLPGSCPEGDRHAGNGHMAADGPHGRQLQGDSWIGETGPLYPMSGPQHAHAPSQGRHEQPHQATPDRQHRTGGQTSKQALQPEAPATLSTDARDLHPVSGQQCRTGGKAKQTSQPESPSTLSKKARKRLRQAQQLFDEQAASAGQPGRGDGAAAGAAHNGWEASRDGEASRGQTWQQPHGHAPPQGRLEQLHQAPPPDGQRQVSHRHRPGQQGDVSHRERHWQREQPGTQEQAIVPARRTLGDIARQRDPPRKRPRQDPGPPPSHQQGSWPALPPFPSRFRDTAQHGTAHHGTGSTPAVAAAIENGRGASPGADAGGSSGAVQAHTHPVHLRHRPHLPPPLRGKEDDGPPQAQAAAVKARVPTVRQRMQQRAQVPAQVNKLARDSNDLLSLIAMCRMESQADGSSDAGGTTPAGGSPAGGSPARER